MGLHLAPRGRQSRRPEPDALGTTGFAQAQPAASSGRHALAASLTHDLGTLSTRYHLAGPAAQAQLLSDLLTVAAERQQLLAALVEDDPGEVVRVALPADLRASLPAAVQALVEEEMEVEGEMEILHADRAPAAAISTSLKAAGSRFALHCAANPPTDVETGARVHVSGIRIGQTLALDSSSTIVQTRASALPHTFGA